MRTFLGICLLSISFLLFATVIIPSIPAKASIPSHIRKQYPSKYVSPTQHIPSWSLLLTGDVIPARVVNQRMMEKSDFLWPLRGIANQLQNADITLINLESPLIHNCPITHEGFSFCTEGNFAQALSDVGVDVVNLANNHSLNYGWEGIKQTEEYLHSLHISTVGFGTFKSQIHAALECNLSTVCSTFSIIDIKGTKVGFLGYNGVGQRFSEETIKKQILHADTQVHVLVVSMHWGKEYERIQQPDSSLAPDDPVEWGRKLVDWGADVVVGNHPHWYQGMEWYAPSDNKLRPIFYALGNTVFDQEWSKETKQGVLMRLQFQGNSTSHQQLTVIPIGIRDYGEAYLLEGEEKKGIEQFFQRL